MHRTREISSDGSTSQPNNQTPIGQMLKSIILYISYRSVLFGCSHVSLEGIIFHDSIRWSHEIKVQDNCLFVCLFHHKKNCIYDGIPQRCFGYGWG